MDLRHQAGEQRPDGFGAEKHGFDQTAGVQKPLGEDMAAVGIGAKLDFIDRHELGRAVERHGLDRAGVPAGVGGDDLFLAGDEGHVGHALFRDHAVIVFACEQAQRKADHARGVRKHALHREMGLSGVGGAEHRLDPGGEARHDLMVGDEGWECKRAAMATLPQTRFRPRQSV